MNPELIQQVAAYRAKNKRAGRKTIAKVFKLSINEARQALRQLGVKDCPKKPAVVAETVAEDIANARQNKVLKDAQTATARYRELLTRVAVEREIASEFFDVAVDALQSGKLTINIGAPAVPKKNTNRSPEEAVLVISDTHIGKIIRPEHTLGFGNYNPKIFLDQLAFVETTVGNMLRNHLSNPIQRLNILFLGDLVEGMLNHAQEIPNRWLVADQVNFASLVLYQFIARLSRMVPEIVVRGVGGNHARWGTQKKPPTENRYSNFDFIVLAQIEAMLEAAGPSNVRFLLDEGAFQVFDIFEWRFKIGHGDHLKGGDKALGIPAHAIAREINATTQRYAARGERPPDYYLVGDKHRAVVAATARGRYLINGAWFVDDEFAMAANFTPSRPFQLFFGVHPTHGRSWQYDLNITAPAPAPSAYALPDRFTKKLKGCS